MKYKYFFVRAFNGNKCVRQYSVNDFDDARVIVELIKESKKIKYSRIELLARHNATEEWEFQFEYQ